MTEEMLKQRKNNKKKDDNIDIGKGRQRNSILICNYLIILAPRHTGAEVSDTSFVLQQSPEELGLRGRARTLLQNSRGTTEPWDCLKQTAQYRTESRNKILTLTGIISTCCSVWPSLKVSVKCKLKYFNQPINFFTLANYYKQILCKGPYLQLTLEYLY